MRTFKLKLSAAFLLYAFILLSGCGEEAPVRKGVPSGGEVPDQIMTETRMTLTERGKITAVIEANMVKIYEGDNYASLEDSVKIDFYNKKGEHTSTLTAMNGNIWGLYDQADSLRASGDVVVRAEENNAFLEAPAIRWIAAEGIVYGEGHVRLNSENGFEEGTGFEAKDDLSEYHFRGPVSGEVRSDKSDLLIR